MSTLLGGRVIHTQPQAGHRTGIEPVLLAASVPARAGQSVLEGGSGAGAGLLCLAARVCIAGLGVERDPALVALARANAIANGFTALAFEIADIETLTGPALHAHAFANPPWHDAASSASPDPGREAAKRAASGLYARWALRMAGLLVARGTLTFAAPAGRLAESLAALQAAGCGSLAVLPLWPKPGRTPKIVLVQGTKGGRAPDRLLPGLQLHLPEGGYTPEAEAILRDGAGLDWGVTSR